jgi:hypothetical protein
MGPPRWRSEPAFADALYLLIRSQARSFGGQLETEAQQAGGLRQHVLLGDKPRGLGPLALDGVDKRLVLSSHHGQVIVSHRQHVTTGPGPGR